MLAGGFTSNSEPPFFIPLSHVKYHAMHSLISFGFSLIFVLCSFAAPADQPQWGQTGHRTIGEIATDHLTNRTRKQIEKLLNGHSLAYVSTFGDEIKSDKRFDKY